MDFKKSICKFITCEIHLHGNVKYFAKLADNSWVAVRDDGNLDWVEITATDFNGMLETVESIGAAVRFTNHSAA